MWSGDCCPGSANSPEIRVLPAARSCTATRTAGGFARENTASCMPLMRWASRWISRASLTAKRYTNEADFAKLPSGFGFLVPKKERRRLVACTWVGTKFPYRVPAGKVVARCFLGGMEEAGVLGESDEEVTAAVTQELREIAGVTAPPRFTPAISRSS